jgi:hypothetical protein
VPLSTEAPEPGGSALAGEIPTGKG